MLDFSWFTILSFSFYVKSGIDVKSHGRNSTSPCNDTGFRTQTILNEKQITARCISLLTQGNK